MQGTQKSNSHACVTHRRHTGNAATRRDRKAAAMTLTQRQDSLIQQFSTLNDWFDTYARLIEMGSALPSPDAQYLRDEYALGGCQSKVWLYAYMEQGRIRFRAHSDAKITRGILALLLYVLDNQPPEDVLSAHLYVIDKIGLGSHLSPARANGLSAILHRMREYAREFAQG